MKLFIETTALWAAIVLTLLGLRDNADATTKTTGSISSAQSSTATGSSTNAAPSPLRQFIGTRCTTYSQLNPKRLVRIQGKLYSAQSVRGNIDAGSEVLVIDVQNNVLQVR